MQWKKIYNWKKREIEIMVGRGYNKEIGNGTKIIEMKNISKVSEEKIYKYTNEN